MKTKDIVIIFFAGSLIVLSGFFGYRMLFPENKVIEEEIPQTNEIKFTGVIDETTLKTISERKDYGEASLDNIGRTNPFGPLN